MTVHGITLTPFVEAYITAALWSTNDESNEQGGEPLDRNYTVHDIHPDTLRKMVEDCERFQAENGELFPDRESDAGHDFWLDRCGHGVGFWDGRWNDPLPESWKGNSGHKTIGEFLSAASESYGEFNLYVGDDGMIYGQ